MRGDSASAGNGWSLAGGGVGGSAAEWCLASRTGRVACADAAAGLDEDETVVVADEVAASRAAAAWGHVGACTNGGRCLVVAVVVDWALADVKRRDVSEMAAVVSGTNDSSMLLRGGCTASADHDGSDDDAAALELLSGAAGSTLAAPPAAAAAAAADTMALGGRSRLCWNRMGGGCRWGGSSCSGGRGRSICAAGRGW